jgi:hypothetical protein
MITAFVLADHYIVSYGPVLSSGILRYFTQVIRSPGGRRNFP